MIGLRIGAGPTETAHLPGGRLPATQETILQHFSRSWLN
jgi:hypothetical protein